MILEFRIEILKGNDAGVQFRLTGNRVLFGRASNCDIVITDASVSRNHAELIKTQDGYVVKDINSSNGVFVNSRKVSQHLLEAGDVFTIGDHAYKFSIIKKQEPQRTSVPAYKKEQTQFFEIPKIPGSSSSKKRIIIYGFLIVFLTGFFALLAMEDDTIKPKKSNDAVSDPFKIEEDETIFSKKIEVGMEELYNRANEYYFSGRREFRLKNYVRALENFKRATTFYPKHGQSRYYIKVTENFIDRESKKLLELGKKLMAQFKYDNAIKCFRDVMDLNVEKPDSQIFKEAEKMKGIAEKRRSQVVN